MRPQHTKRDENHAAIRDGLRQLGAVVWDLADLAAPVLDLLVFWQGTCIPVEVKQPGSEAALTEGEKASIALVESAGVKPIIATSIEDVLEAFEPDKPHWQVIDQEGIVKLNQLMGKTQELAVRLTTLSWPSENRRKLVFNLRDLVFQLCDQICASIERG